MDGTHSWTAKEKLEASEPLAAAVAVDEAAEEVAEALAVDEALAAASFVPELPPVTPLEAWPAAAWSSWMFLESFVCSSATLLSREDVSLPDAFACAIYNSTRSG